jgi:hypothetical protein
MKLSHLGALAVATLLSLGFVAAPAHAGFLGNVARETFWTGEKILRARSAPCENRARAERDQMFAISKNNPYGTESAIKANAQAKLSDALRACKRF